MCKVFDVSSLEDWLHVISKKSRSYIIPLIIPYVISKEFRSYISNSLDKWLICTMYK